MAAERLNMRKIREVLRLRFSCGIGSVRAIARSAQCGKTSVFEYLAMASAAGITEWAQVESSTEADLEKLFYPTKVLAIEAKPNVRKFLDLQETLPDWRKIHDELRNPNVTMALMWSEYRVDHPNGYSYTQFLEYYNRWKGKLALVMRQIHRPGEKGFVDYCDGLNLTDHKTGEVTKTQLFVGALGASCYTFAIASLTQTIPDWTWANRKFFEFIDGVTTILVPDNLKSGVKVPCRYDPVINPAYQELAEHYGTCIIPGRVRKPRDKAKAENAVLQAQRWILAVLRKRVFYTLAEMNVAIAECLVRLNAKVMRGYGKSRLELFQLIDRPALKALPAQPYEWAEWEKFPGLEVDYHLRFDDHFYSAPYQLVKEELWIRATAQVVAIYFKGNRVASHPRSFIKWSKSTVPEHMPSHHRAQAEWTPERLQNWAKMIGPSVVLVVEAIMAAKTHPEQGFKAAIGVISLSKKYGSERVEKAAHKSMTMKSPSYRTLKTMLQNQMEDVDVVPKTIIQSTHTNQQLELMAEKNLRGKQYYH